MDADVQDGQDCGEAATAVELGLVRSRVKSGSATWAPRMCFWRGLVAGMAARLKKAGKALSLYSPPHRLLAPICHLDQSVREPQFSRPRKRAAQWWSAATAR